MIINSDFIYDRDFEGQVRVIGETKTKSSEIIIQVTIKRVTGDQIKRKIKVAPPVVSIEEVTETSEFK